ncbi:armadillo-type protein [Abortiporus biennis]|nr:armadillo-type protein [Abortiporus biennis]
MPRENRKRGKKHKKPAQPENEQHPPREEEEYVADKEPQAGPSWIVNARIPDIDSEAPFGYVEQEVKAYFRTVDVQIREWQDQEHTQEAAEEDVDPNEDRRMFFVAALSEMSDKEKQLATDPDCSTILERMIYSMDDFARRVFMDRFSGSYEQLMKHRFASHVCQTLFSVSNETVVRESRGIFPPSTGSPDEGELRTLTKLTLDVCEEILPHFTSLMMDSFASHVLRALLSLLCPHIFSQDIQKSSRMRSKKSAAYKQRQGAMKSVFSSESTQIASRHPPPKEFISIARKFVAIVRETMSENEVRACGASQIGSPVLQMLLEIEADEGSTQQSGSLMDSVLAGLITAVNDDPDTIPEASDYVSTLLRDPSSSHLLEILVAKSPENVFRIIWSIYFKGKLRRLAVHPVANFVVAKSFERLDPSEMREACSELNDVVAKILSSFRIGVFRALVDRAAALHECESDVIETICKAFELPSEEDRKLLIPCVLRLLPKTDYDTHVQYAESKESGQQSSNRKPNDDRLEPKTQGALLLQSLLHLNAPHNQPVIDSILESSIDDLLAMAYHVTSSRVLDAFLDSPTIPAKDKRKFVIKLIGHYAQLVDDRIGSRVGDRCWAFADPYLKEKIARSLIPEEHTLAGSFYGKFFARKLNLHLLKRDVEAWKNAQISAKASSTGQVGSTPTVVAKVPPQASAPTTESTVESKRKRKHPAEDEIDQLFDTAIGKKVKRADLSSNVNEEPESAQAKSKSKKDKRDVEPEEGVDKSLHDVLGAIKAAPKNEDKGHKKRKKAK